MALTNCPECQLGISTQAHACPRCGYPMAEAAAPQAPLAPPVVQTRSASSWLPWALCGLGTLSLAMALIVVLVLGGDNSASRQAGAAGHTTETAATAGASNEEPTLASGSDPQPAAGEGGQEAAPEEAPEEERTITEAAPREDPPPAPTPALARAVTRAPAQARAPAPAPAPKPAPVDNRPEEEKLYGPGKKVGRYWVTKDTVVDLKRKRLWQRGCSKRPLTWGTANAYCKKLKLAGKTGWRLPSILQLKGLLRGCASSGQCGNHKSGMSCRHCSDNSGPGDKGWFMQRGAWENPKYPWFWASTRHASYAGYHYSMFFAGAYINYYKDAEPYHARCYRPADKE